MPVAVVTGASTGIGLATAVALGRAGHRRHREHRREEEEQAAVAVPARRPRPIRERLDRRIGARDVGARREP